MKKLVLVVSLLALSAVSVYTYVLHEENSKLKLELRNAEINLKYERNIN